jgi:hypothetical protein
MITVDGVDLVEANGMPDPYRMLSDGTGETRRSSRGHAAPASNLDDTE